MLNFLELPKQIDNLIQGLIQFFYGLATAYFRVLAKPVRGSLYLARISTQAPSSSTALFVSIALMLMLFFALAAAFKGDMPTLSGLVFEVFSDRKSVTFVQFVAVAIVAYIILDVLTVGFVRVAVLRRRRRQRAVHMCRFGLAATFAGFALVFPAVTAATKLIAPAAQNPSYLVAICALCLPPTMIAIGVSRRSRGGRRWEALARVAGGLAFVFVIVSFVLYAALWAVFGKHAWLGDSRPALRVDGLMCDREQDGSLKLFAALRNLESEPLTIQSYDLMVGLKPVSVGDKHPLEIERNEMHSLSFVDGPFLVIPAATVTLIHMLLRRNSESDAPWDGLCVIRERDSGNIHVLEGPTAYVQPPPPTNDSPTAQSDAK